MQKFVKKQNSVSDERTTDGKGRDNDSTLKNGIKNVSRGFPMELLFALSYLLSGKVKFKRGDGFMSANVETMFSVREKPWHGLGTIVMEAPTSADALRLAELDWEVVQEPVYTGNQEPIKGYKANVRSSDRKVLGVVSDRYKVVQNVDAFSFTDELLGKGVRYETAGSLQEGRKVWLLARLPKEYVIAGERISSYLVFSNTHDGSGSVKVAVTPVRVVCNNTLNLALNTAKRSFSMIHAGNINDKI